MEEKKQRKHFIIKLISAIFFVCFFIGCAAYGVQVYYFRDKFFVGTTINQIVCDELTAEEAEEKIRQQVEDFEIQLEFRNDVTETISGEAIDYAYVSDGGVKKLLENQNPFLWMQSFYKQFPYTVNKNITFDKEKLKAEIKKLEPLNLLNQETPKDAYIDYENEKFCIVEEVYGTTLKTEELLQGMEEAVSKREERYSAVEADVYEKPEVVKEDELLNRQVKQLNKLANANITYELPVGTKSLSCWEIKDWLTLDEDGNYEKDEKVFQKKIKEFVQELAKEVDTYGKDRRFQTHSGKVVTVPSKQYGWKINVKKEIKALTKNIEELETVSRKPKYSHKEVAITNYGFGDHYIEVNLTEQHLYLYEEGKVVFDSPFVSGRMVADRFTPPGVFFLTYKQRNRVLRGPIDPVTNLPTYESPVQYWMPFNRGIGFHDASWRYAFGGTYYRYGGSHGCINMPTDKAAKLYELIDKEIPIICVYEDGYTLHG